MDYLLARHPLATGPAAAEHACPDCVPLAPNVFCRWCTGSGIVSTADLAAWQADANRAALGR